LLQGRGAPPDVTITIAFARADRRATADAPLDVLSTSRPLAYVAALGGLALITIGFGGARYGMWTAPTGIRPEARSWCGGRTHPRCVEALLVKIRIWVAPGALVMAFASCAGSAVSPRF